MSNRLSKQASKKRKVYELIANLAVECLPSDHKVIETEILYSIINVVERHNSHCGGGIQLKVFKDTDDTN